MPGPARGLRRAVVLAVAAAVLLAGSVGGPARAERLGAYDYPFVDPFAATIIGTPAAYRAEDMPDVLAEGLLEARQVSIYPLRRIPSAFDYDSYGIDYGLVRQDHPAPLAFVIAGTGGSARSAAAVTIASVLAARGMHVVTLPSPSSMNFILNASTTGVPGRNPLDAVDLYRVMRAVMADLGDELRWTKVDLAGFSLGAMNAAYVAELDSRERRIGFDKILLLNPPVSLFNSTQILDSLFQRHIGDQPGGAMRYVDGLIGAFAARFGANASELDLSGDFLYRAYGAIEPTVEDLEAIVGVAFRLSAGNLAFTSDALTHANFIVPADARLTRFSSLTDYFTVAMSLSFRTYIEQLYLPFYQRTEPDYTLQRAAAEESLHTIESFLRGAGNVGLFTNEDDIILAPGELAYLESVFGDRATVFPTGGHGGNFAQRDAARRIQLFFGPS